MNADIGAFLHGLGYLVSVALPLCRLRQNRRCCKTILFKPIYIAIVYLKTTFIRSRMRRRQIVYHLCQRQGRNYPTPIRDNTAHELIFPLSDSYNNAKRMADKLCTSSLDIEASEPPLSEHIYAQEYSAEGQLAEMAIHSLGQLSFSRERHLHPVAREKDGPQKWRIVIQFEI